ncbi:MAG TPA: hypothetical protein PLH19_10190 [Anaerolineae bacterium]|nr:hypothetical protein [Anaerolineae bacterium]HQH38886.1 hypothetical protein [Anaerolineae bacterium]
MTLNVNQHFVDRGPERALFGRMLSGEESARVLRMLIPSGCGKSWLVKRLFSDCEERGIPVVGLDFDARQHNKPVDAHYVVERFLNCWGETRLPQTAELAAEWRRSPLSPKTDDRFLPALGRALRSDLAHGSNRAAEVDGFTCYETGMDTLLVRLGEASPCYSNALTYQQRLRENIVDTRRHGDTPERQAERSRLVEQLNQLTLQTLHLSFNALCEAPLEAAEPLPPMAVLLDTFEQTPEDTRKWLSDWLFDGLRRELAHVCVVVAGRPEPACDAFFEQADLWGHLVTRIDHFEPMPEDTVWEYYRRRGCSLGDLHPATICSLACKDAMMMAMIGDRLLQGRGA